MSRTTRLDPGRDRRTSERRSIGVGFRAGKRSQARRQAGVVHIKKKNQVSSAAEGHVPPLNISMKHKSGGCIITQLRAADSGHCSSADRLWLHPLNEVLSWSRSRIRQVFKSAVCSIDLSDERWIQTSISNRAFWGSERLGKKTKP